MAGHDVYLGVGSRASGGLVRIDRDGHLHIFSEELAPAVAPTHIVVTEEVLLARSTEAVYEWSFVQQKWTRPTIGPTKLGVAPLLFAGKESVWASSMGYELLPWQGTKQQNELFKPTWFSGRFKAGYTVRFVSQRGDEVWFGGAPWERFVSSGLYRFNLETGAFDKFAPADGFRASRSHDVYDGLWLDDRLWLATSEGLCNLTPRKE